MTPPLTQVFYELLRPELREELERTMPEWQELTLDEIQERLAQRRQELLHELDDLFDLYNDIHQPKED